LDGRGDIVGEGEQLGIFLKRNYDQLIGCDVKFVVDAVNTFNYSRDCKLVVIIDFFI